MRYPTVLRKALTDLYCERCSYAEFKQRTSTFWSGLAVYLYRRWRPPEGVTPEDVEQELYLALWQILPGWDVSRTADICEYAVWNACNRAKYMLHQQRGANLHGNHDKNKSRFPIAQSRLSREDVGEKDAANRFAVLLETKGSPWTGVVESPPKADDLLDAKRVRERALSRCSALERVVLESVYASHGNVGNAADHIYSNPDHRRRFRLGNESDARKLVRRVVAAVAARL